MSSEDASKQMIYCGELSKAFPNSFVDRLILKLSCVKKADSTRVWRKVHAMLYKNVSSHQLGLDYFKDPNFVRRLGTIDLGSVEKICSSSNPYSRENMFEIYTVDSKNEIVVHCFAAPNKTVMVEWIQTLAKSTKLRRLDRTEDEPVQISDPNVGQNGPPPSLMGSLYNRRQQQNMSDQTLGRRKVSEQRSSTPSTEDMTKRQLSANDDDYAYFLGEQHSPQTHAYINLATTNQSRANSPADSDYFRLWDDVSGGPNHRIAPVQKNHYNSLPPAGEQGGAKIESSADYVDTPQVLFSSTDSLPLPKKINNKVNGSSPESGDLSEDEKDDEAVIDSPPGANNNGFTTSQNGQQNGLKVPEPGLTNGLYYAEVGRMEHRGGGPPAGTELIIHPRISCKESCYESHTEYKQVDFASTKALSAVNTFLNDEATTDLPTTNNIKKH